MVQCNTVTVRGKCRSYDTVVVESPSTAGVWKNGYSSGGVVVSVDLSEVEVNDFLEAE